MSASSSPAASFPVSICCSRCPAKAEGELTAPSADRVKAKSGQVTLVIPSDWTYARRLDDQSIWLFCPTCTLTAG